VAIGIIGATCLSNNEISITIKQKLTMKNTVLSMCAIALFLLGSCGNNNNHHETKSTSENPEAATDRNENKAVNQDDAEFIVKAADGGMTEVELGKLAEQKGRMAQVKSFGRMMVEHHSAVNDQLKALAATKGITVPTVMSEDKQKKVQKFSAKEAKDFDKDYIDCMIDDHEKDISLFEDKASDDKADPDLRKWAVETLPTLRNHLAEIKKIEAQYDAMKK
jgi:putative membrane protein